MATGKATEVRSPIPNDADPIETNEWLESLDYVLEHKGPERVQELLTAARRSCPSATAWNCRSPRPRPTSTRSRPTSSRRIPATAELERRIKSFIRWNAMAMVTRANRDHAGIGGHISHVRLVRHAVRSRLQPLLPRHAARRLRRRPGLLPRPRGARHVRPRVPRRPPHRSRTSSTSAAN